MKKQKAYHIITYGCQMNISDSERIAAVLERSGYKKAPDGKDADLIVLNACSVRQAAVDRIYGKIRQLRTANLKSRIVVTGCVLAEDKKKLKNKADLIFDIKDLPKLPLLINKIQNTRYKIQNPKFKNQSDYFNIKPRYAAGKTAYVPIMTGCDNFCSYCVVPYTRGREKSRTAGNILEEVRALVKRGCKEIILLGQNVNSYRSTGDSLPSTAKIKKSVVGSRLTVVNFPKLLELIHDLPGDFKIGFITANPKDMTGEMIAALKLPKMKNYLHLPVQAGSDRILRLMNRRYKTADYLKLVEKIRRARPGILIGTDIIVGFPSETKRDFQKTAALCRKVKFDNAYIARYSPRPGTPAARLYKNDIPPEEKRRRWRILDELINKSRYIRLKKTK